MNTDLQRTEELIEARHGFTISRSFISTRTRRTTETQQGVFVSREGATPHEHNLRPLGWHESLKAARSEIDRIHADAFGDAPDTSKMASYWQRLARWFPDAPNPPKVRAMIVAAAEQKEKEHHARRAAAAYRKRLDEAGPDMLRLLQRFVAVRNGEDGCHNPQTYAAELARVESRAREIIDTVTDA